jgi:hypothetical protein
MGSTPCQVISATDPPFPPLQWLGGEARATRDAAKNDATA